MSNPTTNYLVNVNNTGQYSDLSKIFMPIGNFTAAAQTSYDTSYNGISDLSAIFAPLANGFNIGYNTNIIVNNGNYTTPTDLSGIFASIILQGTSYTITKSNDSYTIVFASYASTNPSPGSTINNSGSSGSFVFNQTVSNVQITLVGGGGSGGPSDSTANYGGGGGGGGGVTINSTTISSGVTYTFGIGGGGVGNDSSVSQQGFDTTITDGTSTYTAYGGGGGSVGSSSGGIPGASGGGSNTTGNGGTGGYNTTNATNGGTGYINTYYYGGGGGGGSYYNQKVSSYGGLGGGGNAGFKNNGNANNGENYTGPNLNDYNTDYESNYGGYPGTGGGAGGGNGNGNTVQMGGTGGSGIIILTFQYP